MNVSDYDSDPDPDSDSDDIDTNCLTVFEKSIEQYYDFYKCNIDSILTQFIYIDEHNNVSHIQNSVLTLNTPNFISSEQLINVISKHNYFENRRYSLDTILLFLFDMNTDELLNFTFDESSDCSDSIFTTKIVKLSHINLSPCVKLLQDTHRLTFLFKQKQKHIHNTNNLTNKNKHREHRIHKTQNNITRKLKM